VPVSSVFISHSKWNTARRMWLDASWELFAIFDV
jgi:hypothetical protein